MFAVFGLICLAVFSTATPTGVVGWSPRDFGIVERIVFKTSECSECGMSDSRINVKMCGGATAPYCGAYCLQNIGVQRMWNVGLQNQCQDVRWGNCSLLWNRQRGRQQQQSL